MDVFEHAFLADHGLKRADDIGAFSKAVLRPRVSERFAGSRKDDVVAVR